MKQISMFVITIMLAIVLIGCNVKTPEDYYNASSSNSTGKTVSITIRCDTLLNEMDKLEPKLQKVVPKDGVLLKPTTVSIAEKETVYDALTKVAKENKLVVNFSGNGDTAYIVGINGIKEFSVNPLSGWKYRVNGEFPGVGCGSYGLKEGDKVEILYTCNLGEDLN